VADGSIEIITGRERRRRWSDAEKLRIVSESHEPGASVAGVAARHDICPSLLHGWRRHAREGRLCPPVRPDFVPVRLVSRAGDAPLTPSRQVSASEREPAAIEVVLPSGGRILIRPGAPLPVLRIVIAALRG
jgi:transposase